MAARFDAARFRGVARAIKWGRRILAIGVRLALWISILALAFVAFVFSLLPLLANGDGGPRSIAVAAVSLLTAAVVIVASILLAKRNRVLDARMALWDSRDEAEEALSQVPPNHYHDAEVESLMAAIHSVPRRGIENLGVWNEWSSAASSGGRLQLLGACAALLSKRSFGGSQATRTSIRKFRNAAARYDVDSRLTNPPAWALLFGLGTLLLTAATAETITSVVGDLNCTFGTAESGRSDGNSSAAEGEPENAEECRRPFPDGSAEVGGLVDVADIGIDQSEPIAVDPLVVADDASIALSSETLVANVEGSIEANVAASVDGTVVLEYAGIVPGGEGPPLRQIDFIVQQIVEGDRNITSQDLELLIAAGSADCGTYYEVIFDIYDRAIPLPATLDDAPYWQAMSALCGDATWLLKDLRMVPEAAG